MPHAVCIINAQQVANVKSAHYSEPSALARQQLLAGAFSFVNCEFVSFAGRD